MRRKLSWVRLYVDRSGQHLTPQPLHESQPGATPRMDRSPPVACGRRSSPPTRTGPIDRHGNRRPILRPPDPQLPVRISGAALGARRERPAHPPDPRPAARCLVHHADPRGEEGQRRATDTDFRRGGCNGSRPTTSNTSWHRPSTVSETRSIAGVRCRIRASGG